MVRYVRFQIPQQDPPTVHGSVAQVTWEISGNLETDSGIQTAKAQEVTVLTAPDIKPGRSLAALTEEATFQRCTLALVLVNDVIGAGGYLEGELRARMESTDQAREIRMELHSSESAGDRKAEAVREMVSLESGVQLTSAEPYVWAFSLPVPERTLPSVKGRHTTVSWVLRAVVDTNEAPEPYQVEREVQVFTST
ncbi:MAG TPA: hypothetical protein DIT90_02295 [Dehalococcoidia bacterium]|nr:hypothetical protein [Dehalococcoidia bacterium]